MLCFFVCLAAEKIDEDFPGKLCEFCSFFQDVAKKPPSAVVDVEKKGVGGGFQPFQEKNPSETEAAAVVGKTVCCSPVMEATASSTAEIVSKGSGGNSQREEKESQTQRKRRRRWSSELHRRFVRALQRLGGSQGKKR